MIFNPIPSLINVYDQHPVVFMVAVVVIIFFAWIASRRKQYRAKRRGQ